MPLKRFHEQYDNDTGEGDLNIKKIWIVRGEDGDSENDSDEGIKKIRIVMERRHNYRYNRSLVWKYKGKRSKASIDLWNLWLRPEMRMESQDIGKFNTRNMKLDELLVNFWSIFDELLMKCEWYSIKKILYQLDSFCNTGHI